MQILTMHFLKDSSAILFMLDVLKTLECSLEILDSQYDIEKRKFEIPQMDIYYRIVPNKIGSYIPINKIGTYIN